MPKILLILLILLSLSKLLTYIYYKKNNPTKEAVSQKLITMLIAILFCLYYGYLFIYIIYISLKNIIMS
jgi:hypothetical protein